MSRRIPARRPTDASLRLRMTTSRSAMHVAQPLQGLLQAKTRAGAPPTMRTSMPGLGFAVCMHETQHDVVEGVAHVGEPAFLLVRGTSRVMEPCTCRPAAHGLLGVCERTAARRNSLRPLLAAALDGRVHITA